MKKMSEYEILEFNKYVEKVARTIKAASYTQIDAAALNANWKTCALRRKKRQSRPVEKKPEVVKESPKVFYKTTEYIYKGKRYTRKSIYTKENL